MIEKFEYKYQDIYISNKGIAVKELNKLGKEGWEVINILYTSPNLTTYLFKRKYYETTITQKLER